MMDDRFPPKPASWDDEAFAGSLFPQAHPVHPLRIVRDGHGISPRLDETIAHHDVRLARLDEIRCREESPEERDARWRAARRKAMADIKRERRMGLPPPNCDAEPTRFEINGLTIHIDPDAIAKINEELSVLARSFAEAFKPVAQQVAQVAEAISRAFGPSAEEVAKGFESLKRAAAQIEPDAGPRERYLPGTRHGRRDRR
jgi:hypothetical protein